MLLSTALYSSGGMNPARKFFGQLFLVSTFLLLLVAAPAARAQLSPDVIMETYNSSSSAITNGAINRATITNIQESDRRQSSTSTRSRSVGAASLAYTPSPALKQRTVQTYIDRVKTKNPAAARAVAANLGPGKYDYGTIYKGLIDGYNLRENDAVDALTAYLVLGYMVVNNVQNEKAVTAAMVQGVRAQFGPLLAQNPRLSAAGVPAQLGEEMKLLCVVVQAGWLAAVKDRTLPQYQQGISTLFKSQYSLDFNTLQLTKQGFARLAGSGTPQGQASNPTTPTKPTASAGALAPEGWFFRAISGYPAAISFEPVVLFKNGEYFEVQEEPLERLNVPASKRQRPTAWGTWKKSGATYLLTDSKGRTADYRLGTGSWFPAYPYPSGLTLKKGYQNASGGDYGNGTSSLAISKIYFLDATHFSQGTNAGIVSANAAGGSKTSATGTYNIHGNTLALTYADGRVVQKSFAFGAAGTPAHPTPTLIFIGGDTYTDID